MTREEQAAIDRLRIALHSARPQQVIWINPDDLDTLLHILDALKMTRGGAGAITAAAPKSPPPPKPLR